MVLYIDKEDRSQLLEPMNVYNELDYNLLLCSHLGTNQLPKAEELYKMVASCIKFLNTNKTDDSSIILYGHGIGGHLAIVTAQQRLFKGLILLNPLGSALEIMQSKYPFIPMKYMLKDKMISYNLLDDVISPVMVVVNEDNEIIPFDQGKRVYDAIRTDKTLISIPKSSSKANEYNNIYQSSLQFSVDSWIKQLDN